MGPKPSHFEPMRFKNNYFCTGGWVRNRASGEAKWHEAHLSGCGLTSSWQIDLTVLTSAISLGRTPALAGGPQPLPPSQTVLLLSRCHCALCTPIRQYRNHIPVFQYCPISG